MSSISSISTGNPQPLDPSEFFKKADTDGSGGISKSELAAVLKKGPQSSTSSTSSSSVSSDDVDKIFAEVDTDGDGEISEAENDKHMEEMAKNGPSQPSSLNGSSDAFNQFVDALKSSNLSSDDLNSLLSNWASQLKEKGNSATLFTTQA